MRQAPAARDLDGCPGQLVRPVPARERLTACVFSRGPRRLRTTVGTSPASVGGRRAGIGPPWPSQARTRTPGPGGCPTAHSSAPAAPAAGGDLRRVCPSLRRSRRGACAQPHPVGAAAEHTLSGRGGRRRALAGPQGSGVGGEGQRRAADGRRGRARGSGSPRARATGPSSPAERFAGRGAPTGSAGTGVPEGTRRSRAPARPGHPVLNRLVLASRVPTRPRPRGCPDRRVRQRRGVSNGPRGPPGLGAPAGGGVLGGPGWGSVRNSVLARARQNRVRRPHPAPRMRRAGRPARGAGRGGANVLSQASVSSLRSRRSAPPQGDQWARGPHP